MRIHNLKLKNIGPFGEEELIFIPKNEEKPPITIITGENGTGKTIILDAIRSLLTGKIFGRNIIQNEEDFYIEADLEYEGKIENNKSEVFQKGNNVFYYKQGKNTMPFAWGKYHDNNYFPPYILAYWDSTLAKDSFEIKNLATPNFKNYLKDSLSGNHKNVDIVQLICYFDYLRTSEDKTEKENGERMFNTIKKIVEKSIENGKFSHVARTTLSPIILVNNHSLTFEKLSSGNLYFLQRMIDLLGKMYAACIVNGLPLEKVCELEGLLLIDEAENHLHPKWQKTLITNILSIFPNLQIIITTHSPFIVNSYENVRVYVCKAENEFSKVEDVSNVYSNMPIEEVLLTPVFNTQPFNSLISNLLEKRKIASEAGNLAEKEVIEAKLRKLNPDYFAYFEVDKLLAQLK
jgi:predicted ATP-binding protein involved in virulence